MKIYSTVSSFLTGSAMPVGLIRQAGWTTIGYGTTQVVRLAAVVILTRLLAPELFGAMILLTSLRVGIELFTDLGIGQSVVVSRRARDEEFYNTAWTLQLLRGMALGGLTLLALPLLHAYYDDATLQRILPALSVFLVLTGLHSISPMIATKELRTKRIAAYEITNGLVQSLLVIVAVVISPTIGGLVAGHILGAIFAAVASYFILPGLRVRLAFDKSSFWELISFGKWIFISSIIFFLSGYLDRLLLAKYATLALLGIYGVARSLGDAVSQFGMRIANAIVFPKVAAASETGALLRLRIDRRRLQFMCLIVVLISLLIAGAHPLVRLLYDQRYIAASSVLPWIGIATWLAIINSLNDSFALGVSKPHISIVGNLVKLLALVLLLPFGITTAGITGAALAAVAAESARYASLSLLLHRERLSFVRQDILTGAVLLALAYSIQLLGKLIAPDVFSASLFVVVTT